MAVLGRSGCSRPLRLAGPVIVSCKDGLSDFFRVHLANRQRVKGRCLHGLPLTKLPGAVQRTALEACRCLYCQERYSVPPLKSCPPPLLRSFSGSRQTGGFASCSGGPVLLKRKWSCAARFVGASECGMPGRRESVVSQAQGRCTKTHTTVCSARRMRRPAAAFLGQHCWLPHSGKPTLMVRGTAAATRVPASGADTCGGDQLSARTMSGAWGRPAAGAPAAAASAATAQSPDRQGVPGAERPPAVPTAAADAHLLSSTSRRRHGGSGSPASANDASRPAASSMPACSSANRLPTNTRGARASRAAYAAVGLGTSNCSRKRTSTTISRESSAVAAFRSRAAAAPAAAPRPMRDMPKGGASETTTTTNS
mmetsp:Transcript_7146/g.21787  ORF Transcript_7146/g.21787 Transcript_7146/m.21787 type:complete len:368 (+) Transcript_7146:888-1991(+)